MAIHPNLSYTETEDGAIELRRPGAAPVLLVGQEAANWKRRIDAMRARAPQPVAGVGSGVPYGLGGYPTAEAELKRYREARTAEAIRRAQDEAAEYLARREIEDAVLAREAVEAQPAEGYEDPEQQMSVPERVYGRADLERQQSVPETEDERRMRVAREFDQRGWIGISEHGLPAGYRDEDRQMSTVEPLEMERLRASRGELRTEDREITPSTTERRGGEPVPQAATTEAGQMGAATIPTEDELWALEQQRTEKEKERAFLEETERWIENMQRPNTGAVAPPEPPVTTTELASSSTTKDEIQAELVTLYRRLGELENM